MGEQADRQTGSVKWFNATKGYGFITPEGGGADLFVHQTSINAEGFRSLREGEPVEFEVEQGPDGREKAVKVTGPAGAAPQGAPRQPRYRGAAAAAATAVAGPAVAAPVAAGYPARGGGRAAGRGYGRGYYPGYDYAYYDYGYAPRGRGRAMRGRGPPLAARGRGRFAAAAAAGAQEPPVEPSGLQVVVHNLPWSCTWQQLKDTFKEWKVERADVIYDSYTGRSRGFGVVRFASKEEAQAACDKLNNTEIDGRTVSVRIDRFA